MSDVELVDFSSVAFLGFTVSTLTVGVVETGELGVVPSDPTARLAAATPVVPDEEFADESRLATLEASDDVELVEVDVAVDPVLVPPVVVVVVEAG